MLKRRILDEGTPGIRAAIREDRITANRGMMVPWPAADSMPVMMYGHSFLFMLSSRMKPTFVFFSSSVCSTASMLFLMATGKRRLAVSA